MTKSNTPAPEQLSFSKSLLSEFQFPPLHWCSDCRADWKCTPPCCAPRALLCPTHFHTRRLSR